MTMLVGNAPIQTLTGKDAQFDFRHVGLAGAFALKPTVCVNAPASADFSLTFPVITAPLNR
jgi:hypothetical protein